MLGAVDTKVTVNSLSRTVKQRMQPSMEETLAQRGWPAWGGFPEEGWS